MSNMFESLVVVEPPLLKVPIEALKKAIRTSQKYIEKEVLSFPVLLAALSNQDQFKRIETLKAVKRRIENLLKETKEQEALYITKTKARIAHLNVLSKIDSLENDEYAIWSQKRLDRIMVDYLLRNGHENTAAALVKDTGIELLVDSELFTGAKKIQLALKNKSCTEALAWCLENKTNLKKQKSSLEFMLRLQEYIELIKSNKIHDALKYAKINFPQFSDTCGPEIQQSTALLCYNPHTNPRLYKEYYLETRWSALTKLFNTTYYSMATLPLSSLLKITLQAGLASLKTQDCSTKKNYNCPTCSNIFGQLAEPLKNGVKGNSCLICSGNKSVIGSGNLPMVLPSGRVYSQSWINQMMENDGKILCMDTGNVFQVNELKKAFIL